MKWSIGTVFASWKTVGTQQLMAWTVALMAAFGLMAVGTSLDRAIGGAVVSHDEVARKGPAVSLEEGGYPLEEPGTDHPHGTQRPGRVTTSALGALGGGGAVARAAASLSGTERALFERLVETAIRAGWSADRAAGDAKKAATLTWADAPPGSLGELTANADVPLGRGQYHEVFTVAEDPDLVVKVRRIDQLAERGNSPASEWENALKLAADLGGPRVDGLTGLRMADGSLRLGIALERLRGQDLGTWLRDRPPTSPNLVAQWRSSATDLARRVGSLSVALEDYHPRNLVLTDDGRVVPIDIRQRRMGATDAEDARAFFGGTVAVLRNVERGHPPLREARGISPFFTEADAKVLRNETIPLTEHP